MGIYKMASVEADRLPDRWNPNTNSDSSSSGNTPQSPCMELGLPAPNTMSIQTHLIPPSALSMTSNLSKSQYNDNSFHSGTKFNLNLSPKQHKSNILQIRKKRNTQMVSPSLLTKKE